MVLHGGLDVDIQSVNEVWLRRKYKPIGINGTLVRHISSSFVKFYGLAHILRTNCV